jgi:excinuclease ABC subunit A
VLRAGRGQPSACIRAANWVLLSALGKLGERGNTLVVVEHDEDIRRADNIIDIIGPGTGQARRALLARNSGAAWLSAVLDSLTGRYLASQFIRYVQGEAVI